MQAAILQAMSSINSTGNTGMRGKFEAMQGGDAFLALLEGLLGDEVLDMGSLFADMPIGALDNGEEPGDAAMFTPMQNLRRRVDENLSDEAMLVLAEMMQAMEAAPLESTAEAQAVPLNLAAAPLPQPVRERTQTLYQPDARPASEANVRETTADLQPFGDLLADLTAVSQPAETLPMGQMEFAYAVQAAKALVASEQRDDEIEPLDIEALQAHANRTSFDIERTRASAEFTKPVAQDVTRQLGVGILENLGRQEAFVVKLSPEGLGEITVKMVEKEGKLLLSIATTSEAVTKAIQDEVAQLQGALKPLEAEVHEIVTMPDGAAAGGFHFEQQFTGERQFGNGYTKDTPEYYTDRTPEAAEAVAATHLDDGALSIYI